MKKLERRLGLNSVVAISVSSMLGSGIFVLPGLAFAQTGPSVWLAYMLSAICVLPAAISKSELATAMPTSGGTYVYLERTFGPLAGTVAGLGLWLSLLLKSAFALVGFGAYLSVLADVPIIPISVGFTILITFLNIIGVGKVSSILTVIVSIAIIGLLLLSGAGSFMMDFGHFSNEFPMGIDGLLSATGLVFVSYAGVTKVAAIAEEIKDPEKNLPRGILISLGIVSFLYCFVTFVLAGTLPLEVLSGNVKTIHTLAVKVGGPFIGSAMAILGVVTMTSMANAGLLAASRFPFAMGRDNLLPSSIGKLSKRFLTPVISIVISGLVIGVCLLTLEVAKIAKLASAFMLIIYMCENIAVIVLREMRVQWYKPTYKAIFYPGLQIFGIIATLGLLFEMGFIVLVGLSTISIPGILIFLVYSRKRTSRKGVIGIRGKRSDLVEEPLSLHPHCLETVRFTNDANAVVSLFGKERSPEMLVEMGIALTDGGNLEVAHLTEAPEQTDLNDMDEEPASLKSLRRRVKAMAVERGAQITFDPVVSHDIMKTVYEISLRLHCRWLVKEWGGRSRGTITVHNPMGWLKDHLNCKLAVFRDVGIRYIRRVCVILNEDANDRLVVNTADHLAKVYDATEICIMRFIDESASEEDFQKVESYLNEISKETTVKTSVLTLKGKEEIATVLAISAEYDLLVTGYPKHHWTDIFFGSKADKIMADAACSVMAVQDSREINS